MNISNSQVNRLRHFVRAGLRSLFRPEPQTAVEWADANYYLPKESAYQEGRWETLPFQRAIMNAMGSDYIREVNVVKSARVGYSKMLLGVYAYFIEHKQRNTLIWLPTDGDAENFMKTHVEPTIRDIPSLLALAPWYGKKHRDNTLTMKRFSNGRGFWCLGGKAAKNYREKSVDVAGYDELAAFDDDIEQEGSPTFLGDKRIEGSVWPKSIRGSTPKVRGTCQIERAASESPHFMRFHVACPHCGEEQYLKFGDKETPFGLKWTPDDPSRKHGLFRVIPIKGASVYGKPVASMPRKRNKNGVYLTEIGTDTAKEQIYNRFTLTPEGDEPLPGAVHFPNNPDIFDLTEAQQLTAEEQVEKWVDGRKKILWDSKKRRNEALDCFVYALAALRISISRWQLDLSALLASLQEEDGAATNKKTLADYARALSGEDE